MKTFGTITAVFGVSSLVAGISALAADSGTAGVIAGVLGLVAGCAGVRLAWTLRQQQLDLSSTEMRLEQLERATAEQIQARLTAEADVRVANQNAQKAQIGSDLLADRLRTIRTRNTGAMKDLTDPVTGLYGEEYFTATVDARVASARRHLRPVTVVLIEAVCGVPSGSPQPADPMLLAHTITETVREADTACRLIDGRFALILEDTPENGAIWTVERFRRQIVTQIDDITVWAGVAGYPAHAFDADSVVRLAEQALHSAREWGRDRIEVAPVA